MGCSFCGHSTPHGCWDAHEAANCGNMTESTMKRAAETAKAIQEVAAIRRTADRPPSKAQIERLERAELARLKKKYETD